MNQPTTDEAAERRRAIIASARASVEAEGLEPSSAFDADAEQYIAGTVSADELVARAEARYGAATSEA
jgi:hypothetical protein